MSLAQRMLCSNEHTPGLSILCSVIGRCQTNAEWSDIRFNCPKPSLARLAWSVAPVPWQRGHTGPEGSTVVHGWISMCNVAEGLHTSDTDDVCEVAGQYICGPLQLKCVSSRNFLVCNADTTDQMHQCFSTVVELETMFLLHTEW